MKRLRLALLGYFLLFALWANAADIYVSPTGSDFNDGSKDKPLATLNMALRKARDIRRQMCIRDRFYVAAWRPGTDTDRGDRNID